MHPPSHQSVSASGAPTPGDLARQIAPESPESPESPGVGQADRPGKQSAYVSGRLAALDDRPTSEHAEVFDDLHRHLQEALATAQQPRS